MSNDDNVFKSPDQTKLRFGKSIRKKEKKRKINISPSQNSPKNSPVKTINYLVEQEDSIIFIVYPIDPMLL
jgi:hypothetical protein